MSLERYIERTREIWWLYSLAMGAGPMLVMSTVGLSCQLREKQQWAKSIWDKCLRGETISVSDVPLDFLPVAPEVEIPEELRGQKGYKSLYDFSVLMSQGRLQEIIFVNLVFIFESEIGGMAGDRSVALSECFERRHCYAHSAGFADEKYLKKLERAPIKRLFLPLAVGDPVKTTDEILRESVKILITEAKSACAQSLQG